MAGGWWANRLTRPFQPPLFRNNSPPPDILLPFFNLEEEADAEADRTDPGPVAAFKEAALHAPPHRDFANAPEAPPPPPPPPDVQEEARPPGITPAQFKASDAAANPELSRRLPAPPPPAQVTPGRALLLSPHFNFRMICLSFLPDFCYYFQN